MTPSVPGYERLALIGKGGFSRVYRAEQSKLKRNVAIKVLNFGLSDEADRRSFERETELMGRVSTHPNIVTVHDTAFTAQGQPCIVMEHYRGGSLAELISEAGALTAQEAVEVGVAIASALDASHSAGVVHCDLKPQNILISDFGQAALGDFGISTFAEERTRTGSEGGAGFTLAYAAPEIVEGESPSVATDLYSLAATLYTALAGHRPFVDPGAGKPTPAEHARRILLEDVPALTGVPPEVARVILSAMSKDPEVRPASAAEFATTLYQVGQQLGYGTPAPSTLGRATLPVYEPEIAPVEAPAAPAAAPPPVIDRGPFGAPVPAASPAPAAPPRAPRAPSQQSNPAPDAFARQREPSKASTSSFAIDDATVHRIDADITPRPLTDETTDARPEPGSSRRGLLAGVIGVLSLLLVGGVLYLTSTGDSADDGDPAEDEVAVATPRPAPAVVQSPNRPVNVEIERLGVTRVRVSWEPVVEAVDAGVVAYEIRRQGDPEVYSTTDTEYVIGGVAANEAPCVTIVAVRGNRVSSATDPMCVGPQVGASIAVRPEMCEQGSCEVRVVLSDFAANSPISILVLDPDGRDINGFGEVYETRIETDARAQIDNWRLSLPPLLDAGEYLVIVGDDVGETFSALLTVTATE